MSENDTVQSQYRPNSAVPLFCWCVLFFFKVIGDIDGADTRCNMGPQLTNLGFRYEKKYEEEGSSINQHVHKRRKPFWSECQVPEVLRIQGDITDIIIYVKTIQTL